MLTPQNVSQLQNINYQNDIDNLKSMKDSNATDEKMMETAKEFEAVFVSKLFQVMDKTISRDEGFLSQGKNEKMFRSFYHNALAKEIVKTPETSFGLAKQMYEQMKDFS